MFTTTPLSLAFDDLNCELVALDRKWTCDRERASLRCTSSDVRHHVCMALSFLDGASSIMAHEAYLSVLALGQLLLRAYEDRLADTIAIAEAQCAVDHVLDLFTPYVSGADIAMRRVLLEDVSIEDALEGIGDAR
jgi:hypothetical protein